MRVTISVPSALRSYSDGAAELFLVAGSVREALDTLEQSHGALYRCVCDETGEVRRHVNVFVNTDHIRDLKGIDTPLAPGDVVTILPAVSGGWSCRIV